MTSPQQKALKIQAYGAALQWYTDNGVDAFLLDEAQDRKNQLKADTYNGTTQQGAGFAQQAASAAGAPPTKRVQPPESKTSATITHLGAAEAKAKAIEIAKSSNDLNALQENIAKFDGIAIKRLATNMVFGTGQQSAPIMIIGEAPGADEDRVGAPFMGTHGQLLDLIFKQIGHSRETEEIEKSLYLTNILNWRPPGNRSPTPGEIDVSLPLIEKHIMLAQPKVLVLCGTIAAKTLLGRKEGISRLRGSWHGYRPQTPDLGYTGAEIPAIATYHPEYLLTNPAQKRAVWQDVLKIAHKLIDT